ncbi:MAG: transposase, partial [Candidatus Omnitrophica bacterium]|nr:transposase [Candidatus Omnitrophota bacterium]
MGRLPRVYAENILYYITSKSGNNQEIFLEPDDYKEYISLIARYKKQYGFKLFSYVLLPTQLNLLVEVKNKIGISVIMHDINSLYTKTFNSRYNRKGHLFQSRFKAVLIEKQPYLLDFVSYIHLIPQILGFVDKAEDYSYSSLNQYLDLDKRNYPDVIKEVEEVFAILPEGNKFFNDYHLNVTEKQINDFKKNIQKKRILGSVDFIKYIEELIIQSAIKSENKSIPKKIPIFYFIGGGILIIFLFSTAAYFYKKSSSFKLEYNKTLTEYNNILNELTVERDKALKANQDIEDYEWKIRLAEQALEKFRKEREIEGYTWRIKLNLIGGEKKYSINDVISFKNNRVVSANISKEGF